MKNLICPYTTRAIADIETNREHIVPDALGGPNGFALRACQLKNTHYGASIDSRLIHAPWVNFQAASLGIDTRNGPTLMRARGELATDGSAVDITFGKNSISSRLRVPVVRDPVSGVITGVRGFGDDARNELARIQKQLRKKGREVSVDRSEPLNSKVKSRLSYDRREVAHGLGKIAYLMTVWTLGDAFVETAGAGQYRAWIEAEPSDDAFIATGLRILPLKSVNKARPEVPKHFHVLTCLRMGQQVATTVQLFGEALLGFGALVDTPELPASASKIRIVLIDPLSKTFEERETALLR